MKHELQISGMNCGGCELLVKDALEELDGVTEAAASHLTGSVAVDYDPEQVSLATIKAAIEAEGFTVKG